MCPGNPNCGCHDTASVGLKPLRNSRQPKILAGPAHAESPSPMGHQHVSYAVTENGEHEAAFVMMAAIHKALTRMERRLYDHSHPVDERISLATAAPLTMTIQPDFEIRERIESVTASLPVGITSANLKLGQDTILLYSGAATTTQIVVNLQGLGIQLDRDDERIITFTGAPTTGFFLALAGHTMETWGDR
jgi:hypothetical protein